MPTYPHMCRMDHQEIGHSDSGDDERCPLCRQMDGNDALNRENAVLRARVAEMERDNAEHALILEQQDRTLIRYREALKKIERVCFGLEFSDTEDEQITYWSSMAIQYRQIAREALSQKPCSHS